MKSLQLSQVNKHYLEKFSPSQRLKVGKEIAKIIKDNNTVASSLESPRYKKLVQKIRTSLPDIFTGEISCVDGRLPSLITHLPKITRTWKEPGAVALSSNFDDRLPTRLAIAIKSHFEKYPGKQLIEFVQAHTSLHEQKNHGCGATKLALVGQDSLFDSDGGLAWNLRLLQKTTAQALTNQARKDKNLLTTVLEVLDTDTAGIVFGLDKYATTPLPLKRILSLIQEEKVLSASHTFHNFSTDLKKSLTFNPQTFHKLLADPANTYQVSILINTTREKINQHQKISDYLDKILTSLYPHLNNKAIAMIKYRFLHNLSFGLLTDFFAQPSHNKFNHHHEQYISIGEIGIGDEVVSMQAFRVNHTGFKQIIEDLTIMLDLLKRNGEIPPPFIVFLVEPVAKKLYREDPYQQTLQRTRTQLAKLRRVILNNGILSRRLHHGEFILLPAIVEEKNQEILEIPLFY